MPQVRVTFTKAGGVKVDAEGFKGDSCEKATAFLDDLFGEPTDRSYKPEYHETTEEILVEDVPSGHCG